MTTLQFSSDQRNTLMNALEIARMILTGDAIKFERSNPRLAKQFRKQATESRELWQAIENGVCDAAGEEARRCSADCGMPRAMGDIYCAPCRSGMEAR